MAEQFDPETDTLVLREHLKKLKAVEKLSDQMLHDQLVGYLGKARAREAISRPSLQRFRAGAEIKNISHLRAVWEFLAKHPVYKKGLRAEKEKLNAPPNDDEYQALFHTLMNFFYPDSASRSSSKILKNTHKLIGNYLMFRPDMRPLIDPVKPSGLLRVSNFVVSGNQEALKCEEKQDFGASDRGPQHKQINEGVFFGYGDKICFIMRGRNEMSLKFGVLDVMQNWVDTSMHWFRGKLFVFSDLATFPVVNFFCARDDGSHKTGYVLPSEIKDAEVRANFKDLPKWNPRSK